MYVLGLTRTPKLFLGSYVWLHVFVTIDTFYSCIAKRIIM